MLVAPVVEELAQLTPPARNAPETPVRRCSLNVRKGREIGVPVQVVRGLSSPPSSRASPLSDYDPPPRETIAPLPPPPGDLPRPVTCSPSSPWTPVPLQVSPAGGGGGIAGLTMPCLTLPSAPLGPPKTLAPPPLLLSPWSPSNSMPLDFQSPKQHPAYSGMSFSMPARLEHFSVLEAAMEARHSLSGELEEAKRRCASLEHRLDVADTTVDCGRVESAELRKRLSVCEMEVEVLRSRFSEISQEQRENMDTIKKLSDEVDRGRTCITELEKTNSELHKQRDAAAEEAQLCLERVTMEAEDLRQRVATLEKLDVEWRQDRCVLSRQLEEEAERRMRIESELREAQTAAEASCTQLRAIEQHDVPSLTRDVGMWRDAAVDAQEALRTTREQLASQASEFELFISRVRNEQVTATERLLVAKREIDQQQNLIERLQQDFFHLQEAHTRSQASWAEQLAEEKQKVAELETQREAHATVQSDDHQCDSCWLQERLELERTRHKHCLEEQQRREFAQLHKHERRLRRLTEDRVLTGFKKALSLNIARDMRELEKGVVLEKVHEGNCRREPRFVAVAPDDMVLKWGKDRQQLGRSHSRLDLYEVIRIHYGSMSRACVLHPDLAPWLCFSLYTSRRSFDFCCPEEAVVRRFVLGISRLCDWASGAVASRSKFVAAMGWCKLEDHCFRQQTSLSKLFLQAIRNIASSPVSAAAPTPLQAKRAAEKDAASTRASTHSSPSGFASGGTGASGSIEGPDGELSGS